MVANYELDDNGQAVGTRAEDGVPDLTLISNIDEVGINRNLEVRYKRQEVYVSIEFFLYSVHSPLTLLIFRLMQAAY